MGNTLDEHQYKVFLILANKLAKPIVDSIRQLLNYKHLYQSVKVTFPDADAIFESSKPELVQLLGPALKTIRPSFDDLYKVAMIAEWSIQNRNRSFAGYFVGGASNVRYTAAITISPESIRNFCRTCENAEPFNFIQGGDLLYDINEEKTDIQVFAVSFECQGCKGTPEVFLIRREGIKLTLSGRSPMESVIVAPQIPKPHNKFISDATVAFNSGQTLAGIFILRTFIEQYVRSKSKTPNSENIDLLFQDYASTLPMGFKDSFPSLKSIYDNLSVAIHGADASTEIYTKAKDEIEHHFEGKKAFRIF
jgi:hypothetical protein